MNRLSKLLFLHSLNIREFHVGNRTISINSKQFKQFIPKLEDTSRDNVHIRENKFREHIHLLKII